MQEKFVKFMDSMLDHRAVMIEWIILIATLVAWVFVLELITATAAAAQ